MAEDEPRYLSVAQLKELKDLARESSERAQHTLEQFGPLLKKAGFISLREARMDSRIPGFPRISHHAPQLGEFVALVIDMRDSTKHLRQAITGTYSLVERVYLETSILLPVCARVIEMKSGSTTEFTGDGLIALFNIDNAEDSDTTLRASYKAAKSAIDAVTLIVNPQIVGLALPALQIGIGLALSRAIVSSVGDPQGILQDNAFGECVFFASKLAKWGRNEIYGDVAYQARYPKKDHGPLKFRRYTHGEITGFLLGLEAG